MLQQRPEVLRLIFQALTSSYVASIGAEARRVIDGVVDIVVNECQGTHADAVEFLERGFFIHAMLAANVFEHADEVPTTGAVLESLNLL